MTYKKIKKVDKDTWKIVEVSETSSGFDVVNSVIKKSGLENDIAYLEKELKRKKDILKDLK